MCQKEVGVACAWAAKGLGAKKGVCVLFLQVAVKQLTLEFGFGSGSLITVTHASFGSS